MDVLLALALGLEAVLVGLAVLAVTIAYLLYRLGQVTRTTIALIVAAFVAGLVALPATLVRVGPPWLPLVAVPLVWGPLVPVFRRRRPPRGKDLP